MTAPRLAAAALCAFTSVAAAGQPASSTTVVPITVKGDETVTSIQLTLNGTAASAGEIRLHFIPQGGETIEIRIDVAANSAAASVASDLAKALTAAIAPSCAVSRQGLAGIKVATGKKQGAFRLKSAGQAVPGLTLTLS